MLQAHAAPLVMLCTLIACSTPEPADGPSSLSAAERFCGQLGETVAACGGSDCDRALVSDCSSITGLVNEPLLVDGASCLASGGGVAECLVGALAAATPTEAHRGFARSFCANCALGVPGCTEVFFDDGSGETGLAGKIVLPFGDSLVAALTEKCTSGFTCAATFQSCAQRTLIELGLPTESAQCFLETLISGGSSDGASCVRPGVSDAGSHADAGVSEPDATIENDAGAVDSGLSDAGWSDTGLSDAGQDAGPVCTDPHEPNETMAAATDLGAINSDHSFPAGVVEAWIGDRDYDWFTFSVHDVILGGVAPNAELDAFGQPAGVGFSVCIFYECDSGSGTADCPNGTPAAHDGLRGCCATGSEAVAVGLRPSCPGFGESGRAHVRVEGIGDPVCDPYSLAWGDR